MKPSQPAGRRRVLYVVNNFVAGGAERHLLELWSRMDRDRFEISIACFRNQGQFAAEVLALGWPILDLGMNPRIYDARGLLGLARLTHYALSWRPHVIHGYLFGPNLFAALAGRLASVPAVVVSKRNMDDFETPRQVRIQCLAHRLATHVTAVSRVVGESSVRLGVPAGRVTVIPNGVDADRFGHAGAASLVPRVNGDAPIIGSVGCLAARKDYGTLLEAASLLAARGRKFRLVLVGDGPERAALERRALELGLAHSTEFLGERSDVEALLPTFDVFALSSREEGIPNALLEAMAAGRPAVATAVGGTSEVLTDGETGWLVAPGRPSELADALDHALSDRDEAARRGAAASHAAATRLSVGEMVRRHEAFYASLPVSRGQA